MNARITTVCLILLAAAVITEACQVPVFRYALERWQPDHYQLVIVHDGNLTSEEQANLTYLEENLVGPNGPMINLRFEALDLAKEEKQFARWKKLHSDQNASVSIHLFFPFEAFEQDTDPIWNGNFTRNHINQILDSPARRELVKRILAGDSAVWLFLESGNQKEDEALFKTLEKYAKIAEKEISVPEGVIQQSALDDPNLLLGPGDEENILESSVPLKIAFSILRISRKDPQEVILRAMLLHLEDDLLDKEMEDKPMLFPAFGKGRVLPPLIGAGISEENTLADCGYLCGACSCQVKNQNPGMDILVKADWWTALEGSSVIAEKELPPLTGVEDLIAANEPAKDDAGANSGEPEANASSSEVVEQETTTDEPPISNGLVVAVVLVSGILLIGTFVLNKNREQ
ncbi:MAG: hypothetical protein VCA18_08745 [Opitutales bacterium]|jgi:hypothetical protein